MKATVVIDNLVPISDNRAFVAEHGYSLLLEKGGEKILLDTGRSSAVLHNLGLLGVCADDLDAVVISHGHYDHAGGLAIILEQRTNNLPIYAHSAIFATRYSLSQGYKRSIGMPVSRAELSGMGAEFRFIDTAAEIRPGLFFSGTIERVTEFESGDSKLVVDSDDGDTVADGFADDTSLFYVGDKGLVVLGGCTHAGLVNTVEYGFKVTGQNRLAAWIGGTHLGPASPKQQEATLKKLAEYNPDMIVSGHCTGFAMMAELQKRFGTVFSVPWVGKTIEI